MVKFSSTLGFCVGGNGAILAAEFFVIKRLPWEFETREPILEGAAGEKNGKTALQSPKN